jgi:hypothetical protein
MRGSWVVAVVVGFALYAGSAAAGEKPARDFDSRLSGAQEVPAVTTTAAAKSEVEFTKALDRVDVEIKIMPKPATAITGAHLHCAAAGVNGAIVLNLLAPAGGQAVPVQDLGSLILIEGSYVGSNIAPVATPTTTCPVVINNIASLLSALRSGLIYVNVHTTAFPNGEIRSQVLGKY